MRFFKVDFSSARTLDQVFDLVSSRFLPDSKIKFDVIPPSSDALSLAFPLVVPAAYDFGKSIIEDAAHMRKHRLALMRMPTGSGKTTRIPFKLMQLWDETILVVEPTELLARSAYDFVRSHQPNAKLFGEFFDAPSVVYCSAVQFMTALVQGKLFQAYVYLDESHTASSEYMALSISLDHYKLKGALISASHGVAIQSSPPRQYPISVQTFQTGLDMLSLRSSLNDNYSPKQVRSRTIMFLPDNESIEVAVSVFKGTRLPFAVFKHGDGYDKFKEVWKFMSSNTPRILFTVDVLSTGVTIPAETVWDFGAMLFSQVTGFPFTQKLNWSDSSVSESIQREGRVGRLGPGSCVKVERDNFEESMAPFEIHRSFCWLQLMGMVPSLEDQEKYPAMGTLTNSAAAIILSLPVHPGLLRPLFSESGRLSKNVAHAFRRLVPISPNDIDETLWTPPEDWSVQEFKVFGNRVNLASHVSSDSLDSEFFAAILLTIRDYSPDAIYKSVEPQVLHSFDPVASPQNSMRIKKIGRSTVTAKPESIVLTDFTETSSKTVSASAMTYPNMIQPFGSENFESYEPSRRKFAWFEVQVTEDPLILRTMQYDLAFEWNAYYAEIQRRKAMAISCFGFLSWYHYGKIAELKEKRESMKPLLLHFSDKGYSFSEFMEIP